MKSLPTRVPTGNAFNAFSQLMLSRCSFGGRVLGSRLFPWVIRLPQSTKDVNLKGREVVPYLILLEPLGKDPVLDSIPILPSPLTFVVLRHSSIGSLVHWCGCCGGLCQPYVCFPVHLGELVLDTMTEMRGSEIELLKRCGGDHAHSLPVVFLREAVKHYVLSLCIQDRRDSIPLSSRVPSWVDW